MNLFCFTLEGSTESIYEPPYSQRLKEVLPKSQFSPALQRHKLEWGGSDPFICSDSPQSTTKLKRKNKRSCVPASPLANETLDKDMHYGCWISSGVEKDSSHQMEEMCEAPCQSSRLSRDDTVKELTSEKTQTDLPAQGGKTAAGTAESIHTTGRLKNLRNLVQTKKGPESGARRAKRTSENNDVLSNSNPVITCISLRKKSEKKPAETAPLPMQQQWQAEDNHQDSKEKGVWSPRVGNYLWNPFECPQPWTPFYHTCHQPQHEPLMCGHNLSLPRAMEWNHFESLLQERDGKQSDLCPPHMTCSITDLQLSHITNGNTQRDEAEKREAGGGQPLNKGHRRSSNSLESLCSLNSAQSSSSGVASGSGCSTNRDSLRLDDDLLDTRQFCGRAKVHTDFVPSPYDTESLRLKVGDVIYITAKPPMGIWTGILNGRVGNFKFIYVDVLPEESPDTHKETQTHRVRQKSTVQEVLKHLSMEEHFSSLQLNGYQTVEDLLRLREHHLMELNVTDPEHRHRLLTAVDSLQQLHSDGQLENETNQEATTPSENTRADMNNCPRDSGCHMPSDSSDNSTEDTDLHFISEYDAPAEVTAS